MASMEKIQYDEAKKRFFAESKGGELHHVWGKRTHRLKACRLFMVSMRKKPGTANHHDGTDGERMKMKEDRQELRWAMQEANRQNMSQLSCWYTACLYANDTCPMFRRASTVDREEMAKLRKRGAKR